jgi:outer membrane biosynthesis protein TonB
MRAASILPLAFTAAVLAGCAAESHQASEQETASRGVEGIGFSDRDLTLQAPTTPAVEVASPAELSRPTPEPARRPRVSPKPAPAPVPEPAPESSPVAEAAVPVTSVTVAEVLAEPAPVEDVAVGVGRELAPGKTVTVIPASSGPSSPEDPSWATAGPGRSMIIEGGGGGRGGRCRPRGGVRGIGIAGRIPLGVPGYRLR